MNAKDYLAILRKFWIPIVAFTVLGALVGYGTAALMPKEYRSTASVLVIPSASSGDFGQSSTYVQNVVESYAVLATAPKVLEPVIKELQLSESPTSLARAITVEAPVNTAILRISTVDEDPAKAQMISAAVANSLTVAVGELAPRLGSRPVIRMETIAAATLPQAPFSPNVPLMIALGAIAGLATTVIVTLLARLLNGRVRSAEDVDEAVRPPLLGEVPLAVKHGQLPAAVLANPNGPIAESLRSVLAGLRFMSVDTPLEVILVTSANAGEGKTSVSLGLGLVMAEAGSRVLVIDADLRRPAVARLAGLEGSVGLTSVLVGDSSLDAASQPYAHENLSVLASGEEPPNPGQLITSGRLESVISDARDAFDYVIIDSAPVLSVSDAKWLAPVTDGVLVVTRTGSATFKELRGTVDSLNGTHQRVLGIVLNGVRGKSKSPYYQTSKSTESAS